MAAFRPATGGGACFRATALPQSLAMTASSNNNVGAGVLVQMIASISARLIAEEWLVEPDGSDCDGPFDLAWFDRLALTRPTIYGRLAPKVARMVEIGRAADRFEREAYR